MTAVAVTPEAVHAELGKGQVLSRFPERCRAAFGDGCVTVCFLAYSWSMAVVLFKNGQMISTQRLCDLSHVILPAKVLNCSLAGFLSFTLLET